jgi:transposase
LRKDRKSGVINLQTKNTTAMNMKISQHWNLVQENLFPRFEKEEGMLSENHKTLIAVIEFAALDKFVKYFHGCVGRPPADRIALISAFIAKTVYNMATTRVLIDRLNNDPTLRRICGWQNKRDIPSEATFSRTFAELANSQMINEIHASFIECAFKDKIIMNVSRDSTAIEAREKAAKKSVTEIKQPRKKGRRKKGEAKVEKPLTRLKMQANMSLEEMLRDLPSVCDIGSKTNSKGFKMSWKGYKLHIDTADGDIPISAILTSASVHDSQVALPLARLSEKSTHYLYELMDAAYDADDIRNDAIARGKIALIDFNHRSPDDTRKFESFEALRYNNRSSAERVNSNLKDNLGARFVRVKGHAKVYLHLMFGVLTLAVTQALRIFAPI